MITIQDLNKEHYLGNVKARGNYVVYTKANMLSDDTGYGYNLFVYNRSTHKNKQLTSSSKDSSFIFLDDKTILFASKRKEGKGTHYFTINLEGGEAVEKMDIPAPVNKIEYLQDGKYILIGINDTSYDDYLLSDHKEEIDKLKEEEKDYEVIDELPYVLNGRGFINKLRKTLYLFDEKEGKYEKLSNNYLDVSDYLIVDEKIYFFGNEYTVMDEKKSSLYVYDQKSKECECLLDHRLMIHRIAFIQGKLMIIGHDNQKYEFNRNPEIFIYSNHDIEFIKAPDTSYGSSVSSDARLVGGNSFKVVGNLAYTTKTGWSSSDIYTFNLEETFKQITDFKGSIDCFDLIEDEIYFIGMQNEHLQELYCQKDGKVKRLTYFGEEFEKLGWSKPERIYYSVEGRDYEGFVIYPFDYDPEKKYPGILEIHGGPKVVYGDVYTFEMQLMASQGYFVFYTNPRGADGRGDDFADLYGKLGEIDYQDIMDFVDVVLDRIPQIDTQRIGVTGGSYGGYMTNWIIGHTNRFKVAVSQRSISNYVSKSLTTDIGYYHNMKQTMSTPWSNVEKMWYHSPLKYANKATTPTLFIQSDEDFRCWQGDAYQMYQALILNGCEARMCIFHGENHELSRGGKPKHRRRRLLEMMNWFNQYIGGK